MMTEKSIIVIGAGVGSLASGCYAQTNGRRLGLFNLMEERKS